MKEEIKKEETIVERYTNKDSAGMLRFDIVKAVLEIEERIINLEARFKGHALMLEEMKEVMHGMAQWSSEVETRLQKVDPKIEIVTEHQAKQMFKK